MATTVERTYSARNTPIDRVVPLGDLLVTGDNARTHFDPAKLVGLAESIRDHGLLQPIVVKPTMISETVDAYPGPRTMVRPGYAVVAGERRFRALWLLAYARVAGEPIAEVPTWSAETREALREQAGAALVEVRDIGDVDTAGSLEVMLVENLQREDLDPIEEARGYQRLAEECGWTQGQIGQAAKRSQPAIANSIRLLGLPEDVRALISAGELSVSHGVALAKWAQWPTLVRTMARYAVAEHITSKRTEGFSPDHYAVREVVRNLRMADFDKSICDACPFGARWSTTSDCPSVYCLKPEHFDQLQAEKKAADQARQLAVLAERGVKVEGLAQTTEMASDSYRDLMSYKSPQGCSRDCPCWSQSVNRWGTVVPICTDPKRHTKLQRAETVAENRVTRDKEEQERQRVTLRIDALTGTGTRRELVVLVERAVRQLDRKPLEQVIKRLGIPLDVAPVKDYDHTGSGKPWRALYKLSDRDLVRLGVECLLTYDLLGMRNQVSNGALVKWYLKGADDAAPAGAGDDAS